MDALWQDLRFGWRNLTRTRGFAMLALAMLAIGIGANTAMFSVVNAVLLRPLPFREPDRLVGISGVNPQRNITGRGVSVRAFEYLQAQTQLFENIAAVWANERFTLTGTGDA